jgi:hypothetical protein
MSHQNGDVVSREKSCGEARSARLSCICRSRAYEFEREAVMKNNGLSALARSAKQGFEQSRRGRADFLAGTFKMAAALNEARKKFANDQKFHAWISQAGLASISRDDRAALICIGQNRKAARDYFVRTESWSWRMCAQDVRYAIIQRSQSFAMPEVSQPATPLRIAVTSSVVQEERICIPRIIEAPAEREAPTPLRLVHSKPPRSADGPLPEIVDLSEKRVADAVQAVEAMRLSPDQLREIARRLELLADAGDGHSYTH